MKKEYRILAEKYENKTEFYPQKRVILFGFIKLWWMCFRGSDEYDNWDIYEHSMIKAMAHISRDRKDKFIPETEIINID